MLTLILQTAGLGSDRSTNRDFRYVQYFSSCNFCVVSFYYRIVQGRDSTSIAVGLAECSRLRT